VQIVITLETDFGNPHPSNLPGQAAVAKQVLDILPALNKAIKDCLAKDDTNYNVLCQFNLVGYNVKN